MVVELGGKWSEETKIFFSLVEKARNEVRTTRVDGKTIALHDKEEDFRSAMCAWIAECDDDVCQCLNVGGDVVSGWEKECVKFLTISYSKENVGLDSHDVSLFTEAWP